MRMMKKDTMLDFWNKKEELAALCLVKIFYKSWYDTISWFKK
jgi:hypothetical protein